MAHWPTFEALLRYYITEGFLYVESGCTRCGHVQRVLVFPDAKVVQCTMCRGMTSRITKDIYGD